ncbi:MAG: PDDEXK nuclease domain-containing protein [Tannerella sp.]|jgi:predicted nuclease of restriction endonuclease-like (RecB) superfamily|nr:PDDEXK nuclease domain-containing protein [Tannerella sp.]
MSKIIRTTEKPLEVSKKDTNIMANGGEFFDSVAMLVEQARAYVGRTANLTMCVTYFEVGRMKEEEEQDGKARAEYGRGLLKELSIYLTDRLGRGFSLSNLKNAKKFYLTYSPEIGKSLFGESQKSQSITDLFSSSQKSQSITDLFKVSWTHYVVLARIKNSAERRFYEIEAANQQWSVDDLKHQYNSSLYERLALSRDKDEVMRLSNEGHTVEKLRDVLKSPLVLDFLDMEENSAYNETTLENAIIIKLQRFLLELGKGFLFEARQKRFTFDEKTFFVDLVFYNRLLQCYVVIDLKTEEMKHQDLGQMLMYVNYFDRFIKQDFEKPTVGILLCKEKNDNIVELTLPEDANIYASEYSLYLPDKTLLQQKLAEWTQEFEDVRKTIETVETTADYD